MNTAKEEEIDWDFIIETIKEEKCILFLGPEIYTDPVNGEPIDHALNEYLHVATNPDIKAYYENDGLYLFSSRGKKTKTFYKVKSFYQQDFDHTDNLFRKIAEIPFHLVVSMTPDDKLNNTFEALNIRHNSAYYWMKNPPNSPLPSPSANSPMIYKLLGSIENQESMVLTHDDLFGYFESIFSGNSMPEKLKRTIKDANNFIFLGISFEKWYMQMLLRILYIHNDFDFVRYASNQTISEDIKSFCFEQFRIEFVPTKIADFVNILHEKSKQQDILRKADDPVSSKIDVLMTYLSQDKVSKVFDELAYFLKKLKEDGQDLLDDLVLIENKFNRLKRRKTQGIISESDATVASNKIRKALLDILREAKTLE
jgi:hypothetical protein